MAARLPDTVGIYTAKARLSEIVDRVADGAEFTITKHGMPVAKLIPVKRSSTIEERRAAIESWREIAKGLSLGGLKIRDLINEGRR